SEQIVERFFLSSRRRHTISYGDWSSDVCSSDLPEGADAAEPERAGIGGELGQEEHARDEADQDDGSEAAPDGLGHRAIIARSRRSEERRVGEGGRTRWS